MSNLSVNNKSIQNRINNLMKCIMKTEQLRKDNNSKNKELKLQLNKSFDQILTQIKQKQADLNEKIGFLIEHENDKILNVEYEVHQLLGNLATYMVISDYSSNNVCFMPNNLDKQINQLNEKVNKLADKQASNGISQAINETIKSIENSFDVFEKEKLKLAAIHKKQFKSNVNTIEMFNSCQKLNNKSDYTEWLFKPKSEFIKVNECDEQDYLYLEQNKIDFIDGAIHILNSNQSDDGNKDILECESIEILDEHLADKSSIHMANEMTNSSQFDEKSMLSSSTTETNQSDVINMDDGVSKVWFQLVNQPMNYWLAK